MHLEEIARAKALDCDTSAPRDQRTASTYIFGAVCPKRGKGAALIRTRPVKATLPM